MDDGQRIPHNDMHGWYVPHVVWYPLVFYYYFFLLFWLLSVYMGVPAENVKKEKGKKKKSPRRGSEGEKVKEESASWQRQ